MGRGIPPPDDHVPPERDLDDGWAERWCPLCRLWFGYPPDWPEALGDGKPRCPYCPWFSGQETVADWEERVRRPWGQMMGRAQHFAEAAPRAVVSNTAEKAPEKQVAQQNLLDFGGDEHDG